MKKLIAIIGPMFAVSALAEQRAVWTDTSGAAVAPFGTFGTSMLFVDPATDYVWAIQDPLNASPTLAPIIGGSVQTFYTTTDCTGTAYFALLSSDVINFTREAGRDHLAYVGGTIYNVNVQIQSTWYGGCVAQSPIPSNYFMAAIVGPLTPPSLSSGPYRVTAR